MNIFVYFIHKCYIDNLYLSYRKDNSNFNNVGEKEVKGRPHMFYQVLIDQRDCPFIVRSN